MTTKPTRPSKKPKDHDPDTSLLQAWIPKDLYKWLRTSAEAEDRSLANYVKLVLTRVRANPKALESKGK